MRQQRKIFYVLVPLVAIISALLLAEVALAVFHPISYSLERNMYYVPDQFTGFKLKPHGVENYQSGIIATVNSHGHRDDDVSLSRTPGVFRVLGLGDSFTMGTNVPQESVYLQILEKLLNNAGTSSPIEVVNTGVGGWSPFQYAQYYEHYGREFNPDMILIGFFVGNDSYEQTVHIEQTRTAIMGRRVTREAASNRNIRPKIFFYEHSHIIRLIMNRDKPVIVDFTRDKCHDFTAQYLNIQRRRLNNHLSRDQRRNKLSQNSIAQISRIKALADADNIPLIVLLIPDENQINSDLQEILLAEKELNRYDFGMPQSMFKEFFAQNDIQVIDLLPAFLEDGRCLYMNDTHWTAEGHKLAATVICEKLIGDSLVVLKEPLSHF